MAGRHFLSYSVVDGNDFAVRLHDALEAGPPPIKVWMDKHDLQPGDWDSQIAEAIRSCESLLFVMTRDSVEDGSICKNEWTRALKYKKPIVPLVLEREADVPFRLGSRQCIDFTAAFEPAVAKLRNQLRWLASPAGHLRALKDRLADAHRDRRRTTEPIQIARIDDEITLLSEQIRDQERVVEDPEGAENRVAESIDRGLERARPRPTPVPAAGPGKFINSPPLVAPPHFQDRHDETGLVGEFLKQDALRMLLVVGRGGIGKTAMVCRVLKSLEGGQLPDDGGPLPVDGIVYLSATGSRRLVVAHLFADLCQLLPDEKARELETLYRQGQQTTAAKIQSLLASFPRGRAIVLMDNFETVVDGESLSIRDAELDEALRSLLKAPQHGVKAILTTRVVPRDLGLVQPGRQRRIDLEEGLPSPYAENVLRAMDVGGRVGLRDAPDAVLAEARERTRGFPRALEALFGILSADRDTTLREVLDRLAKLQTENVVVDLVGEAYSRLDPSAEKVMQALAIYARPVPPTAVDYLLQPHLPGVDSAKVLGRLVNMYFARKEAGRYYLHPIDRAYAFSRIPKGGETDRFELVGEPKFTQLALMHRAADYFEQIRLPREDWKSLDDLAPQLAEFDLRYAGEDYESAIMILGEIGVDYMFLWGHYRLLVELQEKLRGKLADPVSRMTNLRDLGRSHEKMGQNQKAIEFHQEGLSIAREQRKQVAEATFLGNLSLCYMNVGQTAEATKNLERVLEIGRQMKEPEAEAASLGNLALNYAQLGHLFRAIEYHEQSLEIERNRGHTHGEEGTTHNLGNCFLALGQTTRAIAQYERAIELNRLTGDPDWEANHRGALGYCYLCVGDLVRARQCYDRALTLRREIGSRASEASSLGDLADLAMEEGRYDDAVSLTLESVSIAGELGLPSTTGQSGLARAHLCAGDLAAARAAAEAACRYEDADENHAYEHLLFGMVALCQNDVAAARGAFATALAQAETMISRCADNFNELDIKGDALCGLAVCGEPERLAAAKEAYVRARAINRDVGAVRTVLRGFDTIAAASPGGLPVDVRAAASGGEDVGAWPVEGWGAALRSRPDRAL